VLEYAELEIISNIYKPFEMVPVKCAVRSFFGLSFQFEMAQTVDSGFNNYIKDNTILIFLKALHGYGT
jgi:hypothetical protein